jgi:hypothetical protein
LLSEDCLQFFFGPSALPMSPDFLRWWAFEVPVHLGATAALNLRQTRQAVDLGASVMLTKPYE